MSALFTSRRRLDEGGEPGPQDASPGPEQEPPLGPAHVRASHCRPSVPGRGRQIWDHDWEWAEAVEDTELYSLYEPQFHRYSQQLTPCQQGPPGESRFHSEAVSR